MAGTAQDVLNIARSQIGTREGRNNSNPYGAWFGMNNVAWCAEFVSWCGWKAGVPTSVIPKHSYTPAGASWFQARGQTVPKASARPGDIVYFKFPGIGRISHVGIVEANPGGGRLITIEGNTDAAGSRTGGGVWRKTRALTLVAVVGRPHYGATAAVTNTPVEDDLKDDERAALFAARDAATQANAKADWMLGQFGFDGKNWTGLETWNGAKGPDGKPLRLTLVDFVRQIHNEVTRHFDGRDLGPGGVKTNDTLVGHTLNLARDAAKLVRKTGA